MDFIFIQLLCQAEREQLLEEEKLHEKEEREIEIARLLALQERAQDQVVHASTCTSMCFYIDAVVYTFSMAKIHMLELIYIYIYIYVDTIACYMWYLNKVKAFRCSLHSNIH